MSRPERRKYALANYTVELRERGWYFGQPFKASSAYRGPYASTASVTLVIARELRREIERRHQQAIATVAAKDRAASADDRDEGNEVVAPEASGAPL